MSAETSVNEAASPVISILIVTYNSGSVLPRCLEAIGEETTTPHEIIVVDNGSVDGTPGQLRRAYPHVWVVENRENRGFAAAMNQGAAVARGEFLVWLNPDTQVQDRALDLLCAYLQQTPDCGLAAPVTVDTTGRRTVNSQPFYSLADLFWLEAGRGLLSRVRAGWQRRQIPGEFHNPSMEEPTAVQVVVGCAVMVPASLYARLGGLDERFFMYEEDFDFCVRVHRAGYRVMVLPSVQVMHVGGGSSGNVSDDIQDARLHVTLRRIRARFIYVTKHFGRGAQWLWRVFYLVCGLAFWAGSFLPEPAASGGRRNRRRRKLGRQYLQVARWQIPPAQAGW